MHRREIIFALLLAAVFLLAAGYFFLTSSFFLTRLVVPWIVRSTGCPMEVERAEWRPLSCHLALHGFRLGRPEAPFLTVRHAQGVAQILPLLQGVIDFSRVELTGAELYICQGPDGQWCTRELGISPSSGSGGSGSSDGPVQVRVGIGRVADSRIHVTARERNINWTWEQVSGTVEDLRNQGAARIRCSGVFRGPGHKELNFSGNAAWDGLLFLDEWLTFDGMKGRFDIRHFAGGGQTPQLADGRVSGTVDIRHAGSGAWQIRDFQLTGKRQDQETAAVALSGGTGPDGQYQLEVRRLLLSGQLLSLLMDIGTGIQPGQMRVEGRGTLSGSRERFQADVVCHAERQAGPVYFKNEKIDLPAFQLEMTQNVLFDWARRKVDFPHIAARLFSGGKEVLAVRKEPESANALLTLSGLDLTLLQFLLPDVQQTRITGGRASGSVRLCPGEKLDTLTGEGKIRIEQAGLGIDQWRPGAFDCLLDGKFFLPLAGGLLKIDRFQADFSHRDQMLAKVQASGSIPLQGGRSNLSWSADCGLENLLAWLQTAASGDLRKGVSAFLPAQVKAAGVLAFAPDGPEVRRFKVEVSGASLSRLELALLDKTPRSSTALPGTVRHFRWETAFPAACLPELPWGNLQDGSYSGGGQLTVRTAPFDISLQGEMRWQELAGCFYNRKFSGVSGYTEFSLQRNPAGIYSLNKSVFHCRLHGNPAFRLESTGQGDPATGKFHADVRVRYVNEHLLNLVLPDRFRSGQLSGHARISGDFRNVDWDVAGYFGVEKLQSHGAVRPVNGELRYQFSRQGKAWELPLCYLLLSSEGQKVADLQLEIRSPEDPALPTRFYLQSDRLDLSSLYQQISPASGASVPEPVSPAGSDPAERRILQVGPRAREIHLALNRMSWGREHLFALNGMIRLQRNRVKSDALILESGQGKIRWDFDGMDFPTGMIFKLNGSVDKPFALAPVSSLLYPDSGMNGTVESGFLKLHFRRLFAARWGEDLVGEMQLRFRDLDLPVNAANGPLSRLLLLPVETIIRADQLIPATKNVRKHFETLWKYKLSAQSPFARLRFEGGDLHLDASAGSLLIKRMCFTGEPLSRMETVGSMKLLYPYELQFDSHVQLCGVQARLPVRGHLFAPQVPAWKILAQMPGKTLAGWLDILVPGSKISGPPPKIPLISPFFHLLGDVIGLQRN